ncbi:MAG: exosortase-associated EpsI family protein [Verrucomicrobiota bacterium]
MKSLKPLAVAQVLVLLLGGIFLLPAIPTIKPAAIAMNLPTSMEGWTGRSLQESDKVRAILAKDTGFEKSEYFKASTHDPGKVDYLVTSIVLGGSDPNNSIHRPERCLPAQGNSLLESSEVAVDLGQGETLKTTRLKTIGEVSKMKGLHYYWFIGHSTITNSHYKRTLKDMSDRVLRGYNQRWAYVTIFIPYGEQPEESKIASLTEEEADAEAQAFIAELFMRVTHFEYLNDYY